MKHIAILLSIFFYMHTAQAAEFPGTQSIITVQGEATTKIAPDQVTLPVTVRTENKVLNTAKQENDQKVQKLLDIAKEMGIPKDKIRTHYTSVNPVYDYVQNDKPRLRGYEVQTSLGFILTDIEKLGRFMNVVVEMGIDQLGSVSFSLQDERKFKTDTLLRALQDASDKAGKLAAAANMQIGRPLSIVEGGVSVNMPPPPMPMMRQKMAMMAEGAMDSGGPQLPGGVIEIMQTVTVTYELK